ncbi:MAG: hypothetical protein ABIK76_04580 [candidate division WOR-3 bacterium]
MGENKFKERYYKKKQPYQIVKYHKIKLLSNIEGLRKKDLLKNKPKKEVLNAVYFLSLITK